MSIIAYLCSMIVDQPLRERPVQRFWSYNLSGWIPVYYKKVIRLKNCKEAGAVATNRHAQIHRKAWCLYAL